MNPNEIKEHPDVLDVLIEKYPSVFKNMDAGSVDFLPPGWYGLMDKLCEDLSVLLDEERAKTPEKPDHPLFSVMQIKEKFGGLRFYYMMNTENEELHKKVTKLIDITEDTSYSVCEITGNPGILCKSGWHFHTYCEEIRIKHGYQPVGQQKSD